MIGDILIIDDYHLEAGDIVMNYLRQTKLEPPYALSVSGESGSGKTEIALVLKNELEKKNLNVYILGQDDYFKLPPHSNHRKRKNDSDWVGTGEVKLQLMDEHIKSLLHDHALLEKPLIDFKNNSIGSETVTGPFDVVIAEGTYTALLKNADVHVFIDRDYINTKKHRLTRNRDQALEGKNDNDLAFLNNVLEKEHKIISEHKKLAHIVIPPPAEMMEEGNIAGNP